MEAYPVMMSVEEAKLHIDARIAPMKPVFIPIEEACG